MVGVESLLVNKAYSHRPWKSGDTQEPACIFVSPTPAPANSGLQSVMAAASLLANSKQSRTGKRMLGNVVPA